MAQQKTTSKLAATNLHSNVTQSRSLLNVNELETRSKATVKDIEELYAALQGLVPKTSHHHGGMGTEDRKARSATSGNDTDTAKSSDEWAQPRLRRYHSEKYSRKQMRDTNMNLIAAKPAPKPTPKKPVWEKTIPEKPALDKTLLNERQIVSDTEAEINPSDKNEHEKLQRQLSLPAYDDEVENEENNKGSKFLIFRRHRQSKTGKKKNSSWRSFFSTLSLKRRRSKKRSKNKIGYSTNTKTDQIDGIRTPKHQTKNGSLPKQERTPKVTPRPSLNAIENTGMNSTIRKSKRIAPQPPTSSGNTTSQMETPSVELRQRCDTLETKSHLVQEKLSAWYKQAVKETSSLTPKLALRATRSHENLLTDSEIMRKRGTFTSDTDSFSAGDRNNVTINKTRVRKTRARRNRRRERARFHSCPNVKLVSKALEEAEKKIKTPQLSVDLNNTTKDNDLTDNVPQASHCTTVKPVEAKLSFGSNVENDEPITDFMKLQTPNARNWLTRQCSRTTISCIRPLQLNLFYSESPSRETVYRSQSAIRRTRVVGQESGAGNPHEFAFKIRRSSSRRRKRRSFKRGQTRLPHQSPFYVPPNSLNITTKDQPEDFSTISKDSGLGFPEHNDDKRFGTFPVMKRDQRLAKLHSESEDSGWASSHRHFASTSETGIQTDPVIVMTAVSKVRRPVLTHVIKNESEA